MVDIAGISLKNTKLKHFLNDKNILVKGFSFIFPTSNLHQVGFIERVFINFD